MWRSVMHLLYLCRLLKRFIKQWKMAPYVVRYGCICLSVHMSDSNTYFDVIYSDQYTSCVMLPIGGPQRQNVHGRS